MIDWCENCGMGKGCIGHNDKPKSCANYILTRFDGSLKLKKEMK